MPRFFTDGGSHELNGHWRGLYVLACSQDYELGFIGVDSHPVFTKPFRETADVQFHRADQGSTVAGSSEHCHLTVVSILHETVTVRK